VSLFYRGEARRLPPYRVFAIRHADTTATNQELSALGLRQITKLAAWIKPQLTPTVRILTSSSPRALKTARQLADNLGLGHHLIKEHEGLRGRNDDVTDDFVASLEPQPGETFLLVTHQPVVIKLSTQHGHPLGFARHAFAYELTAPYE
jgi:phosphohistidine phosphatase SixA